MKKRIISLVLAISILLTQSGCGKKQTKNNSDQDLESTVQTEDVDQLLFTKGTYTDIYNYLADINKVEVEYNHAEYYFDTNDYHEVLALVENQTECQKEHSEDDFYLLCGIIEENSGNFENYDETIKEELKKALLEALIGSFKTKSNFSEDFCKLSQLKITMGNLEENVLGEYHNVENLIIIDYEQNKNSYLEEKPEISFIEYLAKCIQHEINHARQYICECREKLGQLNKSVEYKGLDSNIEASAESQLYHNMDNYIIKYEVDTFDFNYYDERQAQGYLLLMGMFKENFTLEKYYKAIFDSDLKKLYELYELNTEEDYKNFYNIVYALDTLNGRSGLSLALSSDGIITNGQLHDVVDNDYKIALFKSVIKDLIKKINNNNLSLGESLKLYNFIKALIINDEDELVKKDEKYVSLYNESFINGIGIVEDIFYQFICSYYEIPKEELDKQIDTFEFRQSLNYLLDYAGSYGIDDELRVAEDDGLVEKFPIIKEITFCLSGFSMYIDDFDDARENNLILERKIVNQ